MADQNVDLAIIGAGSGTGVVSSAWKGKRVAIAEERWYGGTCLNAGCIPSKMLARTGAVARSPVEAERLGVTLDFDGANWPAIRDRIFGRLNGYERDGRERFAKETLWISEPVRLTGARSFRTADGDTITAEQLVLAAGSRPFIPSIPGADRPEVYTSDSIMRIEQFPRRLVIVGGGANACEFAAIFAGLGSDVVQLVRGPRVMPGLDRSVGDVFAERVAQQWTVKTGVEAEAIVADASGTIVRAGQATYPADAVLFATGRTPNTDRLGAADAGIDLDREGRVIVDTMQRASSGGTPLEGVFALGDIATAGPALKHVANYEAQIVAQNVLRPSELARRDDRLVPFALFSSPEVATAGLTEHEAREHLGEERVAAHTARFADQPFGWAMEDATGLCTVITDTSTGRVVGAHIVGHEAALLLHPILVGAAAGRTAAQMAGDSHWIHPALTEVIRNALSAAGEHSK